MAADNLRERNSRRKMLRAIKESLEQLTSPYISHADLRQLGGIQQLWMSMSLEKERYLNQYFQNCTLSKQDLNPPGSFYVDFGSFKFGKLMDVSKEPRWQVQAAWNIAHATVPHMKVLMYSGIIENKDELFRGELLAIIDVISQWLNMKSLHLHIVASISVFSRNALQRETQNTNTFLHRFCYFLC
ncbi:uncharacterized protein BDCG_00136 [Blastomyces dermatitidis ER-3]|uniref:Uncharacterized protein n=1 Tax=Ajellomyces dermatitidis (strain ER-3 / ATCC MYA-2586) TaxID=559297 RepID=A0ABP2EJV7_AJEDR|nr:uncharacterized protein BDCG_00136 [Blastomyces dermatitidis ER-3]EEQ83331.2 hypothetical protein BDCG_00136 [Blastomyces dermatitidis ER-3]